MFAKYVVLILALLVTTTSFAGIQGYNGAASLGVLGKVKCTANGGLTCAKTVGTLNLSLATAQQDPAAKTRHGFSWQPSTPASATSVTGLATVVYLTQIRLPEAISLTGIQILNAATVGTNKYVVALFNSSGVPVANSALAGATTAGASAYQAVPFTAPVTVVPGTYWMAVYINGTTDTYYALPAIAASGGLAGSVAGQTFGTVAPVVLPTTFTADKGPVAFVY